MSWSEDALYAKAKLFMTRAFFDVGREDALFPFWCSLGLELLGRAVVAHTHPVLLADPSEPENLFYAFGYEVTAPKSVERRPSSLDAGGSSLTSPRRNVKRVWP